MQPGSTDKLTDNYRYIQAQWLQIVCVRVCMCACVRACVRVCVCEWKGEGRSEREYVSYIYTSMHACVYFYFFKYSFTFVAAANRVRAHAHGYMCTWASLNNIHLSVHASRAAHPIRNKRKAKILTLVSGQNIGDVFFQRVVLCAYVFLQPFLGHLCKFLLRFYGATWVMLARSSAPAYRPLRFWKKKKKENKT